jgi:hypothetical protein
MTEQDGARLEQLQLELAASLDDSIQTWTALAAMSAQLPAADRVAHAEERIGSHIDNLTQLRGMLVSGSVA